MSKSLNPVTPTIATWNGRDIEGLSRDELLEAVRFLGRALNRAHDDHQRTINMWESCRKAAA